MSYHLFGVETRPAQLANLALHLFNAWLLYHLVRSLHPDALLAFLAAVLLRVSPYTMRPASSMVGQAMLLSVRKRMRALRS